jgi:hypothetical protein
MAVLVRMTRRFCSQEGAVFGDGVLRARALRVRAFVAGWNAPRLNPHHPAIALASPQAPGIFFNRPSRLVGAGSSGRVLINCPPMSASGQTGH